MKSICAIILLVWSLAAYVSAVEKRDLLRLESEISILRESLTEVPGQNEEYVESPLTSSTSNTVQHKTSALPGVSTVTFTRASVATQSGVSTSSSYKISTTTHSFVSAASSPRMSTSTHSFVSTSTHSFVSAAPSPRISTSTHSFVSTSTHPFVSTSTHPFVNTASSPRASTSTYSFVNTAASYRASTSSHSWISTASPSRASTSSYSWIGTASSPRLSSTFVSSSWSSIPSFQTSETATFSKYTPNSGYPDNGMKYSDLPTSSSVGNSVYAGSVYFVTPTPSVSVSPLYPIEPTANITFKWQYTGLRVRPVNITLNAVGPNSVTYNITTVDGATSEVTWNLGSVPTNQPLPNGYYGIELYDQRGLYVDSEPGHMDPCTTLTIAMYTPDLYEPYTTLANYCPTCYYSGSRSKFHEVLRPICFTFVVAFMTCVIFLYNVLS